MIVNAVYYGLNHVHRIYHAGQLILQRDPVQFHVLEDGKLIVVGALSANSFPEGLYLDCSPDADWIPPVVENGTLILRQVYSATPNGNTLEVE